MSHGGLAIDPTRAPRAFEGTPVSLTALEFDDPAHAAGAAGFRVHPRVDPRRRLCRQYSCRRPHHRQPCPQHPRQDGRRRLRVRDRDRPRRRLQTGTLRGIALIDASARDRRPDCIPPAAKVAAKPQPRGFSGSDQRALAAAVQPVFSQGLPESADPADRVRTDRAKCGAFGGVSPRSRDRNSARRRARRKTIPPDAAKARRRTVSADLADAGTGRTRACCRRGRKRARQPRRPIPPSSRSARA